MTERVPIPPTRTFRIFVSSTFSDLKAERNALQERVFPRLRELCAAHGCRFQAIDLRWGVSEEASLDQQTMRICLGEIARCQQVTPRPNFIVLLGDRYGWCPPPPQIPASEFEEVSTRVFKEDRELLEQWYHRDNNAAPPEYVLQPRERGGPYEDWQPVEARLHAILAQAAQEMGLGKDERLKYEASATHQEVVAGALQVEDASEHVFCFFRTIEGLPHNESTRDFLDLDADGNPDTEARERQERLRAELWERLSGNIHEYEAAWTGEEATTDHIDQLCEDVYQSLSRIILQQIGKLEAVDPLDAEISAHAAFGEDRARHFTGRTAMLEAIGKYAGGGNNHPLVVWGESGSGKSALIAKAVQQAREAHPEAEVVYRFIGATPDSSGGRALLEGLCREVYGVFDFDKQKRKRLSETKGHGQEAQKRQQQIEEKYSIPSEFQRLSATFQDFLTKIPIEEKLVLFLDALDQLSDVDNARNLAWLPAELPEHVRVVVSTISGECREMLERKLPGKNLVELQLMPPGEGETLLDLWLAEASRTLQPGQRADVLGKFEQCGLPLYLKLAFEEARRWHSYDALPGLSADVPGVIRDLLSRLSEEENHGQILVSRSLGYLAAAKNGLSESEMLDVLSRDEDVMADFRQRSPKSPEVGQLPVVVWSRLHTDLEPYLTERGTDGASLMGFYHRQLDEVVATDYVGEEEGRDRHRRLAGYFASQALWIAGDEQRRANLRKVSELPHQQTLAELWDALTETLCDLHFVEAKCAGGMTYDLIADYDAALDALPEAREERRVEREREERVQRYTEEMVAYARAWNDARDRHAADPEGNPLPEPEDIPLPEIIPSVEPWSEKQVREEAERSIEHPTRLDRIRAFSQFVDAESHGLVKFGSRPGFCLQQAYNSARSGPIAEAAEAIIETGVDTALLLQHPFHRPPYTPYPLLLKTLEVHTSSVGSVYITPDGKRAISGSSDKTLRVWDLESGECLKTIESPTHVKGVYITQDGKQGVSGGRDATLRVWDLESGECLKTIKGHTGPVDSVSVTPDGNRAVSRSSGDRTLRTWDLGSGECLATIEGHTVLGRGVSITPDGNHAVLGSDDYPLWLWDLESGECLKILEGHTGCVKSVCFTSDGKRAISGSQHDKTFRVWDLESGQCLRVLEGKANSTRTISCTLDNKRAVSGDGNTLQIWDLESGTCLRVLKGHTNTVTSVRVTPNGKRAVSGSSSFGPGEEGNGSIRVWDLERGICLRTLEGHKRRTVVISITSDGKRALSRGEDSKLREWDLESGECLRTIEGRWAPSVSVTPDNKRAVATVNKTLWVWDLEHGEHLRTLEGHTDEVTQVCVTSDGKRAVSYSTDKTLRVWDLESGECLRTLGGPTGRVYSLDITDDGRQAILGGLEYTLRLWDLESGKCSKILRRTNRIWSVDVTPDGKRAISGGVDMLVWDLEKGECLGTLKGHTNSIEAVDLTPDGRLAVSGGQDETMRLWDLKRGKCLKVLEHAGVVWSVSLTPDGRRAISGTDTVRVWDLEKGTSPSTSERHTRGVRQVHITSDGKRAVSGSADKILRVWDLESGECLRALEGHTGRITCIAITPDRRHIVSGGEDHVVRIWDLESGRCLNFRGQPREIGSMLITPDGMQVISGSDIVRGLSLMPGQFAEPFEGDSGPSGTAGVAALTPDGKKAVGWIQVMSYTTYPDGRRSGGTGASDRTLRIWDVGTGSCLHTFEGYKAVHDVSVTPDGRLIVMGDGDESLFVWDVESGASLRTLAGPGRCRTITPDGRKVISGGKEGLQVWDFRTGKCLGVLGGSLRSEVRVTPDGKHVVSADQDRTLWVWDLETRDYVAVLQTGWQAVLSEVGAKGMLACGTNTGDVILLTFHNLPMEPPIVTPVRIWLHGRRRWDDHITSVCLWCGKRFPVADRMLDVIGGIARNARLSPDQSPCLELPVEAWDEPRLLFECPICHGRLRFNPFAVDEQTRLERVSRRWWQFWKK